ncbi:FAD-dependent oxidoreductase [Haliangium ochraceum]|uniref:FAD-dependent pyridine nucleotide-disulphide oxidoreductase n=1 Tax=Haliangium ochraceum (strain DSM 14365 / JCM 11303 / SMP-2) TaxID=502025 RepID=D0LR15_HALO1|nr:FAD/NAD(P)-binding protein [Haliangium ochraceum]ACY15523.1 FAD-dependent pyridine nucleotide-disulphide oxidoreductase [Haliangium ochraceum DSM 14365]
MLDWLIIGGGPHGHHLAARLLSSGKVTAERLCIIDPHSEPFAVWRRCTRNTGMRFLRSPQVHHIGIAPFALRRFAESPSARGVAGFRRPYARPALALFDRHCDAVRESFGLAACTRLATARAIVASAGGLRVDSERGALEARNVALAIGGGDCLQWPEWARELREAGAPVHHVFEPDFSRAFMPPWEHALVVGGGITAAQTALALVKDGPGRVTMLSPHAIREHMFDADPGWLGPKYLRGFHAEQDPGRRRAMIRAARRRGSMPPELAKRLREALRDPRLSVIEDRVVRASVADEAALSLELAREQRTLEVDLVLLATGFSPRRPGTFLDQAVDSLGLPCAPCGYPLVDPTLRWHPRLRVMGALAELEVGPTARNLSGAREAAKRIVTSLK